MMGDGDGNGDGDGDGDGDTTMCSYVLFVVIILQVYDNE